MISVTVQIPEGDTLEQEVDRDIQRFEEWFCAKVDPSAPVLTGIERAIVKTYLWFKTHPNETTDG